MNKLTLSLIIVSILALLVVSHAEDLSKPMFNKPMFSSPSTLKQYSGSTSNSPSFVIPTTPGVSFSYSNNQYQGMSVTSSDGNITTFFPALKAGSGSANSTKITTCVNTGSA